MKNYLEWTCTTISSAGQTPLLAHCFIFNNEVSLTLNVTDQYDALSIIQGPLSTSAAWRANKDAGCTVGGSPEAAPQPPADACYSPSGECGVKGEPSFRRGDRRRRGLCVERVLSQQQRDVFKIEIIVFTGRGVVFSLCRQQTMKRKKLLFWFCQFFNN